MAPSSLDAFLVRVVLSVFKVDWRQDSQSNVLAFGIAEEFDVVEEVLSGVVSGFVCPSSDAFAFQEVEETFNDRVLRFQLIPRTS
jgi:hypothetical protein